MLTDNLPVSEARIFWMVLGKGAPSQRHYDVNKAIEEAERLAKKQNESFVILKAVGIVKPIEVVTKLEEMREWPADQ